MARDVYREHVRCCERVHRAAGLPVSEPHPLPLTPLSERGPLRRAIVTKWRCLVQQANQDVAKLSSNPSKSWQCGWWAWWRRRGRCCRRGATSRGGRPPEKDERWSMGYRAICDQYRAHLLDGYDESARGRRSSCSAGPPSSTRSATRMRSRSCRAARSASPPSRSRGMWLVHGSV